MPVNEAARLQALNRYQSLETTSRPELDELTRLAAQVCQTPIALLSVMGRDRQWVKSKVGLALTDLPRDLAFCAHTILQEQPLVVRELMQDPRFMKHPLVAATPYLRFYAGVPLVTKDGFAIGTLCVLDYVPRDLTSAQVQALETLGRQVMAQLDALQSSTQSDPSSALSQPVVSSLRTSTAIRAEIEISFGFVPPFFGPAELNPQVFESLWQQTLAAYVNNPLPALFKEKLSAYLSRFCAVPYCMICHSCSLYELGVQARQVLELLESPLPTEASIDTHLQVIARHSQELTQFPEHPSLLETSLLYCAVFIFLSPYNSDYCRRELRRLLGPEFYQYLITFMAYVKTCHAWMEAHPEIAYEEDGRVKAHFSDLIAEEPGLTDFLQHYVERVNRERQHWVAQQAAIAERKRHEAAMRLATDENLRLARAINSVSDSVLITDPTQPDNPIIYSNSAFSRMTGYQLEEVRGRNCRFLQGPETDRQTVNQIRQAIANRQEIQVTLLNYRKDGQPFWNELKLAPVFSDDGELLNFVGVQRDITKRKQAEFALQESEERFRTLVETTSDWVWEVNENFVYTYASPKIQELLGYAPEEILGKTPFDLMPETEAQRVRQLFGSMAASHQPLNCLKNVNLHKNGRFVVLETSGVPCFDAKGDFRGYRGIDRDITERERAEEQLRAQATLLDKSQDAILVVDPDDRILFWNQGARRLFGWSAEDAINRKSRDLLLKKPHQIQEAYRTVMQRGEWHGELHPVTKDGQEMIVESRWTLVQDPVANSTRILTIHTDITQKKQLERQFLRAQRMESLGTLAGGIAHDLNNVLTPILMSVQLLQMKVQDPQSQQWLEILESNAKRGADLVKQVLSFARGIDGERAILQLRHLVEEIKKIIQETFPKSIELYTDLPQDLWTISGDMTQLHQILMNLCVNARDAMPHGGTLSLEARNLWIDENYARMHIDAQPGSYVELSVSDTGIGIPAEILDRIFEPFFTTKEVSQGTGLGLSTVLGIVRSHGGFVSVSSIVGKGTSFKVYLPASEGTVALANADSELPSGKGELVLVVDDEASIRDISKTSLESYGYNTLTANDGIEAIALYAQRKQPIDAVIVDMMMPSMDGITTIRTLQKIDPQVKIIAVTGLLSSEKLTEAASLGIKVFLSKPYTTKELLVALQQVLNVS